MARIAQERTAVSKHAHEAAQETKHRQSIHLLDHTVHLIVEPPTAAELYLSGLTTLEVAQHGSNYFVGARIQCI